MLHSLHVCPFPCLQNLPVHGYTIISLTDSLSFSPLSFFSVCFCPRAVDVGKRVTVHQMSPCIDFYFSVEFFLCVNSQEWDYLVRGYEHFIALDIFCQICSLFLCFWRGNKALDRTPLQAGCLLKFTLGCFLRDKAQSCVSSIEELKGKFCTWAD